jgi:sulfite reductase (NADPH) hemoprotein beta-component
MSAYDNHKVLGDGRLGFAREEDVDLFVETLGKFERGEIDAEQWRLFRLLNGVYGQRQEDRQMVRIKAPGGILTPRQLETAADVADQYANGRTHITTRQNFQFHFVKPSDADKVLQRFAEVGITSREACGNSVRNVTQCPYAGVSAIEPFDTTPYMEALVGYFLRGPLSTSLPRKFKIAFGGCCEGDCVGAAFHDLGFLARTQDGRRGFRLTVGGGLATLRRNGWLAHEFLPAEELLEAAEAIVRIFHRTGDRQHRHKARLKFVVDKLGHDAFAAMYREEREKIRAEGGVPLELGPVEARLHDQPAVLSEVHVPASFLAKNVRTQRQPGFVTVTLKLTLGDLTAAQLRTLAQAARTYSAEEEVRTTLEQNVVLRFVRPDSLGALYRELVAAGLADVGPKTVLDVTSCPGAMSCKLAVTHSRGIASHLQETLENRPDLVAKAEALTIKASGCPNSCGQHHVAGLGFQGGVKKLSGKAAPYYHLYVGGDFGDGFSKFGRLAAKIPARRSGVALEKLIALYDAERQPGETPNAFFARVELPRITAALDGLEKLDDTNATDADFIDLGQTEPAVAEGA